MTLSRTLLNEVWSCNDSDILAIKESLFLLREWACRQCQHTSKDPRSFLVAMQARPCHQKSESHLIIHRLSLGAESANLMAQTSPEIAPTSPVAADPQLHWSHFCLTKKHIHLHWFMVRLRVSQGFNGNADSKQRVRILEPLPGPKFWMGWKASQVFLFCCFVQS